MKSIFRKLKEKYDEMQERIIQKRIADMHREAEMVRRDLEECERMIQEARERLKRETEAGENAEQRKA